MSIKISCNIENVLRELPGKFNIMVTEAKGERLVWLLIGKQEKKRKNVKSGAKD